MDEITHMIDENGNVVIEATWNNNTYVAVLEPNIKGGIPHLKNSSINTAGTHNPEEFKGRIVSAITTQRGKHKEVPLVVEND